MKTTEPGNGKDPFTSQINEYSQSNLTWSLDLQNEQNSCSKDNCLWLW